MLCSNACFLFDKHHKRNCLSSSKLCQVAVTCRELLLAFAWVLVHTGAFQHVLKHTLCQHHITAALPPYPQVITDIRGTYHAKARSHAGACWRCLPDKPTSTVANMYTLAMGTGIYM